MTDNEFEKIMDDFTKADTHKKVEIYVATEGLTQDQYKQLLRLFPLSELYKLEEAIR